MAQRPELPMLDPSSLGILFVRHDVTFPYKLANHNALKTTYEMCFQRYVSLEGHERGTKGSPFDVTFTQYAVVT